MDLDIKFDFILLNKQKNADIMDAKTILMYKSSYSLEINYLLNKKEKFLPNLVYSLDDLFKYAPKSDKVNYLYRGITDNDLIQPYLEQFRYLTLKNWLSGSIGECILFQSYLSTTYNPSTAYNFTMGKDEILLKFVIPPNYPMLALDSIIEGDDEYFMIHPKMNYLRDRKKFESEDEILLPRGQRFFIRSVKKVEKGIIITLDPKF